MNMHSAVIRSETEGVSASATSSPWWRRRWAVIAALILAVALSAWLLLRQREPAVAAPAPPVLTVAQPLIREINEWDDYVGRFEASRTVEVRPRVSGQVTAIHFRDGDLVRKGQLLFTIDPRPFAAAVAEARAAVASARSDLELARANLDRGNRLVADEAISQSDLDQLRARVRSATAALAGAEARVRTQALGLEFTQIRAPISGRISDRRVDAGNLVAGGEGAGSTLLTTINALDPIYFSFNGSEALFLKAKRAQEEGAVASPAEVRLQDEADYRWKGKLEFTDNGLDPKSGTIRARATFANPELFLTPGMFGNMRLSTGKVERALLVPDTAIRTDQARKTVFVVGPNDVVAAKAVEVGPVVEGLRVIRSGLDARDRVVIVGVQFARPGDKARTKAGTITAEAAQALPAAPGSTELIGGATFAH